jgi:hypothetical protein
VGHKGAGHDFAKQNRCSPMQPGFLARERQKGADIFLNLLTVAKNVQNDQCD